MASRLRTMLGVTGCAVGLAVLGIASGGCKGAASTDGDTTSSGSTTSSSSTGVGGGETAASNDDLTDVATGSLLYADSLFSFDPDIDPSATADVNAAKIKSNAQKATCAKITASQGGFTIDYGTSCTLPNGNTVSGSVAVAVSKSGGTTTIALTLTNFTIDGMAVAGTLSFATTNGSTFAVTANVTTSTKSIQANLTVKGTSAEITVDGTAKVNTAINVTVTGVAFSKGECWPHGGQLTSAQGAITTTLSFASTTPATGQATESINKKAGHCAELNDHGSCMATACP